MSSITTRQTFTIEPLQAGEHDAVARLLHSSLYNWYQQRLGQGERFGETHTPFLVIPEVYDELDPGEALVARDRSSGAVIGVCFVHPRPTHISIGIVATATEAQGRGVARALIEPVILRAKREGKPVRLVSSALNLDSFSLYTRLGFVPHTLYQDLTVNVPAGGLRANPPEGISRVRSATPADCAAMAGLELQLQGISREKDYHYFLTGKSGSWRTWLQETPAGEVQGFLVASHDERNLKIGPGAAVDDDAALALLWVALDSLHGRTPIVLVPCAAEKLVRTAYAWGARNVELHMAQCLGCCPPRRGVSFPTFLPESG